MPARSVAQATIHFGLVRIPVKLFTTVGKGDDGIKFPLLHDKDGGRLKQLYKCTTCDEPVDQAHTVRGYEHAKGQYVVLSDADFKSLDGIATNAISIEEYIPAADLDPLYIEKSWYLAPDKDAETMFHLMWAALVETGRVAIATYSAHRKQTVVALRPFGELLVLHQLRYQHEVMSPGEVPRPNWAAPNAEALLIAKQMVMASSSKSLDLGAYRDELQEKVANMLARKVEGAELEPAPAAHQGKVLDFMAALRASLDEAQKPR